MDRVTRLSRKLRLKQLSVKISSVVFSGKNILHSHLRDQRKAGVEGTVSWNIAEIIPLSAFYLKPKDGSTSVVGSSAPRTAHNAPLEIGFHSVFLTSVITVKLNPLAAVCRGCLDSRI